MHPTSLNEMEEYCTQYDQQIYKFIVGFKLINTEMSLFIHALWKQSAVNLQSGGQCFIVELWYGTQSSKENAQQFRQGIPPTNQCPITDNNGVWLHPLDRGTLPSFSKITYECSFKGKRSFLWHNVLQEDVSHVNQPKHGLITRRPRFVIMIAKTPKRIEIAAAC